MIFSKHIMWLISSDASSFHGSSGMIPHTPFLILGQFSLHLALCTTLTEKEVPTLHPGINAVWVPVTLVRFELTTSTLRGWRLSQFVHRAIVPDISVALVFSKHASGPGACATGGTRTHTALQPQAPKACVSANSTTVACKGYSAASQHSSALHVFLSGQTTAVGSEYPRSTIQFYVRIAPVLLPVHESYL